MAVIQSRDHRFSFQVDHFCRRACRLKNLLIASDSPDLSVLCIDRLRKSPTFHIDLSVSQYQFSHIQYILLL